jgi:hypothetical protein
MRDTCLDSKSIDCVRVVAIGVKMVRDLFHIRALHGLLAEDFTFFSQTPITIYSQALHITVLFRLRQVPFIASQFRPD